jgi:hypothetical protein
MSYHKHSIIGGHKDGQYKNMSRTGHWTPQAAIAALRRYKWTGPANLSHHTSDMSGHGRGSDDARFKLDVEAGTWVKTHGIEMVDDADEIAALS